MLRSTSLRVLRPEDLAQVHDVLSRDPVADVFVASRVQAVGLDPARLGGEMWGYAVEGRLESLCHAGANLVPVQATPEAVSRCCIQAGDAVTCTSATASSCG